MSEPSLTPKDMHLFMALVAVKGNLNREEQDAISAKLGLMGVDMSWNAVRSTPYAELCFKSPAAMLSDNLDHDKMILLQLLDPNITVPRVRFAEIGATIGLSGERTSNNWDDARNYELAMMFVFLEAARGGDSKYDHAAVAGKLGGSFTEAGVRQKFYKLKKEAEKLLAENGDGAAAAGPATPASTAKSTKGTKSTTGKRSRAAAVADEAAADDDAATQTPTKKARGKKATAATVKKEPEADEVVKSDSDAATSGAEANGDGEASVANGEDEKAT